AVEVREDGERPLEARGFDLRARTPRPERVAAGCVDDDARGQRFLFAARPARHDARDRVSVARESEDGPPLSHLGAELAGVIEEHLIDFDPRSMKGVRMPLLDGVREFERDFFARVALHETRAMLANEPATELLGNTQLVEDDERHRQERLAQMKARKPLLLEHEHAPPRSSELARDRGAGRASAGYDDVMADH